MPDVIVFGGLLRRRRLRRDGGSERDRPITAGQNEVPERYGCCQMVYINHP